MQRLLLPIIILFVGIVAGANILLTTYGAQKKSRAAIAATTSKKNAAVKRNEVLAQQLRESYTSIAHGRTFLSEWQAAQSRSLRGGLENAVQELATATEIQAPSPRIDNPIEYLKTERGPILARRIVVSADGPVNNLVRFATEVERMLPLGSVSDLSIKATDRDPKVDIQVMQLERLFAPMPELPADAPEPSSSGILAQRPDTERALIPKLPDNLVTRGSARAYTVTSGPSDMSKIAPALHVTGVVWSSNPRERLLLANGYVLRPGSRLPAALIKTSARVTLIEIGRDLARFTIETDVFNAVTNKSEKEISKREHAFSLTEPLETDG